MRSAHTCPPSLHACPPACALKQARCTVCGRRFWTAVGRTSTTAAPTANWFATLQPRSCFASSALLLRGVLARAHRRQTVRIPHLHSLIALFRQPGTAEAGAARENSTEHFNCLQRSGQGVRALRQVLRAQECEYTTGPAKKSAPAAEAAVANGQVAFAACHCSNKALAFNVSWHRCM